MRQANVASFARRIALRTTGAAVLTVMLVAGVVSSPGASFAKPSAQGDTLCTTPALVQAPFSPTPPAGGVATASFASPVASPIASPVAAPIVVDDAAHIEALVRAIGACQDERRARTMTRFVTEGYLSDFYAGGGRISRDQFIELARELPRVPVGIVSVSNVQVDPDGTATAEVVSTIGNQLFRATWSFVFEPRETRDATGSEPGVGVWLASGVAPLPVEAPAGAREITVELDDYRYSPDNLRVRGPDIVINATNASEVDHELLVLSLASGVTTRDLLTVPGPTLPPGVTVLGQVTVPAGSDGTLVLVNMPPGEYAVVDLLISANGTPHLALGMEATLTVR